MKGTYSLWKIDVQSFRSVSKRKISDIPEAQLLNGMSLLNVSPNLQPVVIGVVIIAAVMSDRGGRARLRGGH